MAGRISSSLSLSPGFDSLQDQNPQHHHHDSPTLDSSQIRPPPPHTSRIVPIQELLDYTSQKLQELADIQKKKKMSTQNLVFLEGTFPDLCEEFAGYIDNINKVTGDGLQTEIKPLLEANQKDDVLKKLVVGSLALNNAPEKEYSAAYNLLIYLVMQSPNTNMFLPKICENITKGLTTSPAHGPALAVSVLTILFNFLDPTDEVRYNVFQAIIRVVKTGGLFEMLRPQLKCVDGWVKTWDVDEEDQRKLFGQISDVAEDGGYMEEAYQWTLKSLRTFTTAEEFSSEEAQSLSIKALKAAIQSPSHLDFSDLTALPTIQALSDSHPVHHELLEIFSEKDLEDYIDFNDEHDDFLENEDLNHEVLHRKMRLLTLASVAATTNSKELEYKRVAKALQIPMEDVETWIIDVIRAGLIEGKLSQQKQVFLVHRTTYRVFGEKQWREIATRVDTLRASLTHTRDIIRHERLAAEEQKARENAEADKKFASYTGGMNNARRQGAGVKPRDDNDD